MTDEIVVEMMARDFIPWRCLHDGPLSKSTVDQDASDAHPPWARFRSRNTALITKLSQIFGASAVLARSGEMVVGMLRFYPKAVWEAEGAGFLCLQQSFPAGPRNDFHEFDFPSHEELEDRTLKVHCLMISSPRESGTPYLRKKIGTRMVRRLVEWAGKKGWKRVEAEAFEDLPLIYQVTGSAGRSFWEKLGFHVASRFPHPHLREYDEFVVKLEKEAAQAGIDKEKAKDCIVMHLDLA